ncbi:MAG: helix-turn-helix transcriptional regulator [Clostridia bacterium]|nr:helix-turn-helix transcriptional regulator [Clostridia bacterium]
MSEYVRNKLTTVISISSVITILYYQFTKNYVFTGEAHPFWEFVYVDKGEIAIEAGLQQYILKAGELAFHKPDEFHSIRANGTIAPNVIVISFTSDSKAMDFFRNKILFLTDQEKHLLTQIMKESKDVFVPFESSPPISGMSKKADSPFGAEQLILHDLEKLLILIQRRKESILIRHRSMKENQRLGYVALSEKIINILEENLSEKLSLSFLSNQLSLSVSQIKKVFRQQTGCSIIDYFITMKMNEAKRLINESMLNFTQISQTLGYENIGYFSRMFKIRTGMSPSEYALSVKK